MKNKTELRNDIQNGNGQYMLYYRIKKTSRAITDIFGNKNHLTNKGKKDAV